MCTSNVRQGENVGRMSRVQVDQVQRLEEELALLKIAIQPQDAAKDIRDWVDAHATDDYLIKMNEFMNPWIPDKEQKGKKKKKE